MDSAHPAVDLDRGICNNRTLGMILEAIKHGGAALTVVLVAGVVVIVAPSHKRQLLWGALALQLLLDACFGYAGSAWSMFAAALLGELFVTSVILVFPEERNPAA